MSVLPEPSAPLLIVLHQETSTPGRVGHRLVDRGFKLDIRRPALGDPLPDSLAHHAGMVIFGGPQSANDPDEYIKHEIDMVGVALHEQAPFLGVCLGAQMLIKQLGGVVNAHSEGHAEIGYYPITPTDIGQHMAPWPSHVYQWHREGFCDLPDGADLLAHSPDGAFLNQAIQVGSTAFGIQFHPEVTRAMMHRWTVRAAERFALPNTRPAHTHKPDRFHYDPAIACWLDRFLDHWPVG